MFCVSMNYRLRYYIDIILPFVSSETQTQHDGAHFSIFNQLFLFVSGSPRGGA